MYIYMVIQGLDEDYIGIIMYTYIRHIGVYRIQSFRAFCSRPSLAA